MPAFVTWENAEKTIIRQRLVGDWTFEEYAVSARDTQALTGSMSHTVHVIIDFTDSESYPTRMMSVGSSLDRNFPENQGLVCAVRCPPYIAAVFAVIIKLYPKISQNSYQVDSLEEAFAIIRQYEAESSS